MHVFNTTQENIPKMAPHNFLPLKSYSILNEGHIFPAYQATYTANISVSILNSLSLPVYFSLLLSTTNYTSAELYLVLFYSRHKFHERNAKQFREDKWKSTCKIKYTTQMYMTSFKACNVKSNSCITDSPSYFLYVCLLQVYFSKPTFISLILRIKKIYSILKHLRSTSNQNYKYFITLRIRSDVQKHY